MTTHLAIRLPYDKPPLTLNGRYHWRKRAAVSKDLREHIAREVWGKTWPTTCEHIRVELHYHPRDARRRDADNLVPTLKPCIDGIVDSGLIPDDTPEYVTWTAPVIHEPDGQGPRLTLHIYLGQTA